MKKNLKITHLSAISKGVLDNHIVRKSKKQKEEFAKYLESNLPDLNNFNVENIGGNKNIVIGDINNAKYVFTAHYDTPTTFFVIPNFLAPKNKFVFIMFQALLVLIMLCFCFGLGFLGTLIKLDFLVGYFVGLFLFFFQLKYGYPNKNNYNDNTSGVITLIEMYLTYTPEEREKCVFIFFDNEEKGLKGSAAFNKKYKELMESREVINFDCVADGDYIMIIPKQISSETAKLVCSEIDYENKHMIVYDYKKVIYPSDQKKFNHSIGVAAFHKGKRIGYYVSKIHTNFDVNFDEKNIFVIINHFKKLISE